MTSPAVAIKATDKLNTLFERDERLIDVIAGHSPQLEKLRHSPMRKIMSRVTTVAQAARLCKVPTGELLRELNHVLGIETEPDAVAPADAPEQIVESSSVPSFDGAVEVDVRDELSKGGEPFSRIMSAVAALPAAGVLHLRAPFEPVPLLAVMSKRGFDSRTEKHTDDDWSVWFFRTGKAGTEPTPAKETPRATPAASQPRAVAVAETVDPDDAPARTEVWLDVRDMEPPEPLVRTLEAIEGLPAGSVLIQRNLRVPQFLLPMLTQRGFHFTIDETPNEEVHVRIWRAE
ncbi:MAG: DUF2249 domain-containing protein, partial [Gemmatimonadaceae bacterium]